jgi:stage IV sporulation protein B
LLKNKACENFKKGKEDEPLPKSKLNFSTKLLFAIFVFLMIFAVGVFSGNDFITEEAWAAEIQNTANTTTLPEVIVGGHSIGILLQTEGATVVGYAPVVAPDGKSLFPAKEAGIMPGDFILEVNDQKVKTDEEIQSFINQNGNNENPMSITLSRDGAVQEVKVQPIYCNDSQSYRIGLYIRDNTAGIGTLTYYDPESGTYGALGHEIADMREKANATNESGNIVSADIQSINRGEKGTPGEKVGVFTDNALKGTIKYNNGFGIFGSLSTNLDNEIFPEPISIAGIDEITEGAAQMLTVVNGSCIQAFDINIIKVFKDNLHTNKNLIIQVTDSELLAAAGGIVQGMSGSPIIQNNRLVGAVTHVFVNDPTRGYGCFAVGMLKAAKS